MNGNYYDYGNTSTNSTSSELIAGFLITICIIATILGIITIIGQWKTLKKGNKPGWAAIVPIYNQIAQAQMVGVSPWWVLISMIPFVGSIAVIYFKILLEVSTARAFGKTDGFAVGLIFLPFVFYPMLGFGSDKFIGMSPMSDIIFNKQSTQNGNTKQTGQTMNYMYCASCGNKELNTNKYCSRCGKPIK